MPEERTQGQGTAAQEPTEDAWREVGRQFEELGDSLSQAFRAAWQSEETQQQVQSMQDGLEKLADRVNRAVKEARESRQGEKLRTEAEKTAESLRRAGEQTWEDIRPQLVSALKKANAELQRVIKDLEQRRAPGDEAPEAPSGEAEQEAPTQTPGG